MLTQLLHLLAARNCAMNVSEISRALGAQPSAILPMLTLLVRKGRLLEIGPDGGCCGSCGEQTQCNLLAARGARFVLREVQRVESRE
jgi:hypothetical protein